jgi:hypothetical protein
LFGADDLPSDQTPQAAFEVAEGIVLVDDHRHESPRAVLSDCHIEHSLHDRVAAFSGGRDAIRRSAHFRFRPGW